MPKLTKKLIASLKPDPARDLWLWDELPGFGLRVKPSGAASFLIQYRNKHGRSRKFTIGPASVLAVEEARERARKLLVEVEDGKDPAQDRKQAREAETLAEAWKAFEEEYLAPEKRKVKAITRDSYKALYERLIEKELGPRPLEALTQDDIERFHGSLARTPYSANRALAVLSKLYAWRLKERYNPCLGVKRFEEQHRERILSEEELGRLGAALKAFAALPGRLPSLAPFFALTALTGTRKGEWLSARWHDVDFERRLLVLPDSKTGAKVVELPTPAVSILELLLEQAKARAGFRTDAFVLPGRLAGKPLNNPYKAWKAIQNAAGISDLRIHDLRHLFGSLSHRSGASQRTVAMLLGHRQLSTTERYIQGFNPDRKEAAETTAERIFTAMTREPAGLISFGAGSDQRTSEDPSQTSEKEKALQGERPRRRTPQGR